jgi:ribosomal-protein-alanine N-acetyltransferase
MTSQHIGKMQPILESERLLFRPHLIADLDAFCAMEMDIAVRRYVGGHPRSREEAEKRFPNNQTSEAKLAYYIAHKYWGRGFATEAGRAFIQFGWNELSLTRIVANVIEGNDASIHVLQKLAFAITSIEKAQRTFYHFVLQNPNSTAG